jgi:hypothetical protein
MRLVMKGDRITDEGGTEWARVSHANPLEVGFDLGGVQRIVSWTGWFGEGAEAAAGRFPRDFMTWTPQAWKSLRSKIEEAAPGLAESGRELLLRPHARHVVSDPQACVMLMKDLPHGVRLLLDPVSLLTPAMLTGAEDHIGRALEVVAFGPVAAVLVAGADRLDDEHLVPAMPGDALSVAVVEEMVRQRTPGTPVIHLA